MDTRECVITEELKTEWVEALRSGKYVQGTGYLRDANEQFCCLGVLADIINPTAWGKVEFNAYMFKNSFATLSADILPRDIQEVLYTMNDHDKKTFIEIADYIETNL